MKCTLTKLYHIRYSRILLIPSYSTYLDRNLYDDALVGLIEDALDVDVTIEVWCF